MTEKDVRDVLSSSERRDFGRKKLIVDVRYDGGDGTGIANTRDIGVGGLYMTTTAELEIGTPVIMNISVNRTDMMIHGVVVYCDPGHGVGVRFKDIKDQDLDFLRSELELG